MSQETFLQFRKPDGYKNLNSSQIQNNDDSVHIDRMDKSDIDNKEIEEIRDQLENMGFSENCNVL